MEPRSARSIAGGRRLGTIYKTLREKGGRLDHTADHGNAETMIDPVTKQPHTIHHQVRCRSFL